MRRFLVWIALCGTVQAQSAPPPPEFEAPAGVVPQRTAGVPESPPAPAETVIPQRSGAILLQVGTPLSQMPRSQVPLWQEGWTRQVDRLLHDELVPPKPAPAGAYELSKSGERVVYAPWNAVVKFAAATVHQFPDRSIGISVPMRVETTMVRNAAEGPIGVWSTSLVATWWHLEGWELLEVVPRTPGVDVPQLYPASSKAPRQSGVRLQLDPKRVYGPTIDCELRFAPRGI